MKYYLLVTFLFISITSYSQDKSRIKQQALLVAAATKAQDYATVLKYTHPSLIKMVGGNDAMMKLLTTTMKDVEAQGIVIDSVILAEPGEFYKSAMEIHCLMPQKVYMKFGTGKMVANGYLLAISNDKGINWTFLNLTEGLNNQTITQLLPDFNQDLKLPTDSKLEILE